MSRSYYKEKIFYRAPDGFLSAVEAAAKKEHTTVSEWLRRVTLQKLREAGFDPASQRPSNSGGGE